MSSARAGAVALVLMAGVLGLLPGGPAAGSEGMRGLGALLPGWRTSPPGRGLWWEVHATGSARCLGIGARPVHQHRVPVYSTPGGVGLTAASEVVTFSSHAVAARVGRALAQQAGAECLQPALERAARSTGRVSGLRITTTVAVVALHVTSGDAVSFGYRAAIEASPTARNEDLQSVYVDLEGSVARRRLVELQTVSVGQLFPTRTERRLMAALTALAAPSPRSR